MRREEYRRRRSGLEGLPVNSTEVWGFDVVGSGRSSDSRALVVVWVASVLAIVAGVLGGAPVLAGIGALGSVVAVVWTLGKIRRR